MVETAWQALCSKLGELPPGCKSLKHRELQFLLDSLEASDHAQAQALEAAISHSLRLAPLPVRNAVRKLLFSLV